MFKIETIITISYIFYIQIFFLLLASLHISVAKGKKPYRPDQDHIPKKVLRNVSKCHPENKSRSVLRREIEYLGISSLDILASLIMCYQ